MKMAQRRLSKSREKVGISVEGDVTYRDPQLNELGEEVNKIRWTQKGELVLERVVKRLIREIKHLKFWDLCGIEYTRPGINQQYGT